MTRLPHVAQPDVKQAISSKRAAALEPAGLTVSQFGLLAYLLGASQAPTKASSIGTIAEWLRMDPTALNRNLKPLAGHRIGQCVSRQACRPHTRPEAVPIEIAHYAAGWDSSNVTMQQNP
jgi:hypothetical protein